METPYEKNIAWLSACLDTEITRKTVDIPEI